jgi:hypothetical protein
LAPPTAIFAGIAQIEGKYWQDFSWEFPTMQDDIHKLPQARRGSHRRVHRHHSEHFDARGGGFDPALLTSRPD